MLTSHIKEVCFSKFEGAGNDFIIIEDLRETFPIGDASLIRRLCHRQLGIGADGLLLVQKSSLADYRMRIFNSDGAEADMCGNGLRCLVSYLYLYIRVQSQFHIESARSVHACFTDGCSVKTELGAIKVQEWSIPLEGGCVGHVLDTGVPHMVLFTQDIEEADFIEKSRALRYHSSFQPYGVNVNFACVQPGGAIAVRTYERGVEAETLSCGTGAAAVAVAAHHIYGMQGPIELLCRSQERLCCDIEKQAGVISKIFLQGPARQVFDGKVDLYRLQFFSGIKEDIFKR